MTPEELSKLKQGDVVHHEPTGAGYIVLSNRAGVPTVVRSIELHNGSEWSHVYTPTPVTAKQDASPSITEMCTELDSRGWIYSGDPCYRWTTPDGHHFYSLRVAYSNRNLYPTRADLAPTRPLVEKGPRQYPGSVRATNELTDAGWYHISPSVWKSPSGTLYGEFLAWQIMDNAKIAACTAAGARPPVVTFQAARAALVAAGWKNICGKVWRSPNGRLIDGTKAAYDAMNCGAGGNPS